MEKIKIVVVDDDTASLKLIRSTLSDQEMKVSALKSGRDLLGFVLKHDPDLILLDVLMPGMDGFETYRQLRSLEKENGKPPVPVIFLTGEADANVEKRGLKAGAADFLRKPANKDVLLQRIHNTISNSRVMENLMTEANTDGLTGLLNKTGGEQKISEMCATAVGALLMIDLDSFKLVNDLYGHDCGDRVLTGFADILRMNSRSSDVFSRVGGDEFMGFYMGMTDEASLFALHTRINSDFVNLAVKLLGEDHGIPLGVSMGAAFVPEHGTDFIQLFKLSDIALYDVKQNGKHRAASYDPKLLQGGFSDDPEESLNKMIRLMEERGRTDAPMFVSQDDLTAITRYVTRSAAFKAQESSFVQIYLREENEPSPEPDSTKKAMDYLTDIIEDKLRSMDVVCVRNNIFYVLMPDVSVTESARIVDDIIFLWKQNQYSVWFDVRRTIRALD